MHMKLFGFTNVDFDILVCNLSDFLYRSDTGEKVKYNGTVHQLFIDFKKAYVSVQKEVLYNVLIVQSTCFLFTMA
jgi:hypothetical protein